MALSLTHYGHACVLYDDGVTRLLFDPGTLSSGLETLRDLDAVLITHVHPDHMDLVRVSALVAANPAASLLLDPGCVAALWSPTPAHQVASAGRPVIFGNVTVTPLGELHALVHRDIPRVTNTAYLVTSADGVTFLHPGDSFVMPDIDVDVLAVPISGPWLKIGDSIDYLRHVRPRIAVPIHEAALASTATHLSMLRTTAPANTEVLELAPHSPISIA